jgi:Plant protein of unknown function
MVAVFNKELLSWYLITLKLRETVDQNISKSGPSTPNSAPATCNPSFPIPSSQPQPLLLLNEETHHDPQPITDTNPNLNLEIREATFAQEEHVPTAKPEIESDPSSAITRSALQSWATYIQQKLQEAKEEEARDSWAKLSIYRVPKSLRDGDDKSYIPQMVSIGPIHHGKRKLREMEQHKWRAVHRVLQRTRHDIDRYINAIRPLEERIRSCYEGQISMRSDEFLLSLVLSLYFLLSTGIRIATY